MKNKLIGVMLSVVVLAIQSEAAYRLALPGYHYEFPRDHFNHPDYQTEWWYYTGNLHTADGRRFGFELTFFRQGVDPTRSTTLSKAKTSETDNIWEVHDIWMAHLALSDIDGGRFLHTERFNRSGPGIAGADLPQARVWNGNWQARWNLNPNAKTTADDSQQLQAVADGFSFDLSLKSAKPPVIHGTNGVSQKAEGLGKASHYISLTRLVTNGVIVLNDRRFVVEGSSWMDHEFFSNQLEFNQAGWDWLSLQFDDGSELMLYRLRNKDHSVDQFSSGTYIDPQGRPRHLSVRDFSLSPDPNTLWTSPQTGARYPIRWSISIPSLGLHAVVTTRLATQEITSKSNGSPNYWEGEIEIAGTSGEKKPLKGVGYLEMTGYSGSTPTSK